MLTKFQLFNSDVVTIEDGGGSITIDAVALDIRALASGTDSIDAVQSGTWNIGYVTTVTTLTDITNDVNIADGGNSITVDAADLDIRDLSSATDSISAVQSGTWDIGTITNVVSIDDNGGSITVDGAVSTTPDAYDLWDVQVNAAVGSTAVQLAATPLANRLNTIIENLGSQDMYIGNSNAVTTSTGFKIPKGTALEVNFGASATIWAITASGTTDVRVAEFAA